MLLLTLGKALRLSFRQQASLVQRQFEDRPQPLHPLIDPRLTELEHLAQQDLQGIGLLWTKMNNNFGSVSRNLSLRPPPALRLRGLPAIVLSAGTALIRAGEGWEQPSELFGGQSGQRQQLPPIPLEPLVFQHAPSLAYFG